MRSFMLSILCLLPLCIVSAQQPATTSVPNFIRYSGTLGNVQSTTSANPAPLGVTFAIYKEQSGGAPIWQETHNVTPDANGQYSVLLGSTAGASLPDDLFSTREERWLGVQAQGQEEQPRVMLVSVPYALQAHDADTLGGLPASAFLRATAPGSNDAVASSRGAAADAGTTAGSPRALATGISPLISGVMNGPCGFFLNPGPGYIPLFFGPSPSSVICNSVMFQRAGNIGVGTLTPATSLDVVGAINTSSDYRIGGNTMLTTDSTFTNTSIGYQSGQGGGGNVTVGYAAGADNSGNNNVAIGRTSALAMGDENVILGDHAAFVGAGNNNVIIGAGSAQIDPVGDNNTFVGANVAFNARGNSNNIFIGVNSGTQGSQMNNIYLDARCASCDLDHPENNTIRIGTQGTETDAYIQGIYDPIVTDRQVFVRSDGKLGTMLSSLRYKEQVRDMGDDTSRLLKLRPVTFLYKPEYATGVRTLQFGLIAEEVAKVYPELVEFDKDGKPLSVKYQFLAPMLLNELQKEHTLSMSQQRELQMQLQQIAAERQEIENLKLQLQQQSSSLQLKGATLEERLRKLESYVATQVQRASDNAPLTHSATFAEGNTN